MVSGKPYTAPGSKSPGKLAHVDPLDLVVPLVNRLLDKNHVNLHDIESVVLGVVHQEGEQGLNMARMAVLHGESMLPLSVQGDSVDKFCASSMRTIDIAAGDIVRGNAKLILAGGVQSMSRIRMGGNDNLLNPKVANSNARNFMNMGLTAENLAKDYAISRGEQEAFALESHNRAAKAQSQGMLDGEIVSIEGVSSDDCVRADVSLAGMAKLRPNFLSAHMGGTVTPATSSPLTDGASMVLLASESYARENNLPVLARIVASSGSGCAPEIMGIGPVEAMKKALSRANLQMSDIDAIELNEAFAAQSLAVIEECRRQGMVIDPAKLNIDGGAIAMGHPLGASGARLVGHVSRVLQRTGGRYGLATMCIGGGQGMAMIVENPDFSPKP
ncbi:MAG: thiolase family protein [Micavibrio aeruginosavorus]|uniref:acetyl-CoA C-acyltransferase n=1 Tax=Micavibrio aeruginosavorus TaxID=349221 RepID=A0A7T5R4K6_9BACT|nr:MAG: thiolase family protein [Micavibrio aeruginosavorus]